MPEVVELRAEVERLRRENLEFRQQVGYWKSRHRDALLRIAALEQEVEQLEGQEPIPSPYARSSAATTRT